ncbi:MAG: hypothetical protein AB8I69_09990 [Anaerolineae bacterium]
MEPLTTPSLAATYGEETAQTIMQEMAWLNKKGIFRGPVQTYTNQENETYIQQFIQMTSNKQRFPLPDRLGRRKALG